jgi:16S rRNA (uracil1498-N3)-methyltransferase
MRVLIQRGSGRAGEQVSLDQGEIHHLRVRRARDGEVVEILDGAGLKATGRLIHTSREWVVEIGAAEVEPRPPELILAVGAGDRERFSWLVEKSVELGVSEILPLDTEHTAGVATRLKENHVARLRRTAVEALKQCGARWAPIIHEPVPLSKFLQRPPSPLAWLADESGDVPPAELDLRPLTIVVGPEAGFTQLERKAVLEAGYHPMMLGSYTLRFETAALAAALAVSQARLRGAHG